MSKIKFICSLLIFGTIGIISKFIPLSSSAIVFYRAVLASLFLIVVSLVIKRKFNFECIRKNFGTLVLAGIFMGLNWVLQFESFKVSSVSVGTVSYNSMPIFVILLAPILFKEKLTLRKLLCVFVAMIGVILVSNVLLVGIKSDELLGCIYGLDGAFFYALVVMVTKKLKDLDSWDKMIFEFIVSAIIMIPYMIFIQNTGIIFESGLDKNTVYIGIVMLLLLCFVHTGLTYIMYFNSVDKLKAQEVAVLTYIDPVVALILSSVVLHEKLNTLQIIGAILILLSTLINELIEYKRK